MKEEGERKIGKERGEGWWYMERGKRERRIRMSTRDEDDVVVVGRQA